MPKLKTHKSVSKRFQVTKTGKIMKRRAGQNHFNARDTGNAGRNKKQDLVMSQSWRKVMEINLPN